MVGVAVDGGANGAKKQKLSKNAYRRAKKREKPGTPAPTDKENTEPASTIESKPSEPAAQPVQEPDFVTEDGGLDPDDPLYEQFKSVFQKFTARADEEAAANDIAKPEVFYEEDDIPDEDEDMEEKRMSKKARKMASMLSIAELKALVAKPEMVEWTDNHSSDPMMLLAIKAHRNVVPVPTHWSLKREYLSSKRGIEKAAFALPKFIQETGIAEMRDAVLEKQAEQSLKQRQRERVQPKMGKLDIDYQKLHDAFFKFQTKPELTRYGEVYYEGKEYETNLRHLRPGELSEDLKDALNIPPGAPPPWLPNMQKFGPPPSYPTLKIPGLNYPIPPGASWGWHIGGWGKPPVDQTGEPLWGGQLNPKTQDQIDQEEMVQNLGEPVEKTLWGELQPAEESEEESEEEEEEDEEEDEDEDMADGAASVAAPGGLETPGGLRSTVPSEFAGVESVGGEFNLRKQRRGTETEEPREQRSAYTVVPEQQAQMKGFFGSDRQYDIKSAAAAQRGSVPMLGEEDRSRKRKAGDVDVSVDLDALERDDKLTKDEVRKQYEGSSQRQSEKNPWRVDQDDLSDMIAEESGKRMNDESRKRQKKDQERRR